MGCTNPLKAWTVGIKSNGKRNIKVTSFKVDYLWRLPNGSLEEVILNTSEKDNFLNSNFYTSNRARIITNSQLVPCGKCMSCRISRSRQWAVRCVMEAMYHDENCFLTLTYNDENLPPIHHNAVNFETGELCEDSPVHSLLRSDVQSFLKRLRRHYDYHYGINNIRYFGCGEYGPVNYRPHYHLIIFGLFPNDVIQFKKNHQGDVVYRSPTLEKLWGKGFVTVGECNFETAAYTARYITKKFLGESSQVYEFYDFIPEFSMMSLKPGIGSAYYDDHKYDIYKTDELIISRGIDASIKGKPPRYFDNKYDLEDHEHMEQIKEKRIKAAELNRQITMIRSGLSLEKILENQALNFEHKIDQLKRTL